MTFRYAKFTNGKWLIPSTTEKPDRHYGLIQYTFDINDPPVVEEVPTIAICDSIAISKKGRRFVCYLDNYKTGFHQKIYLSREETESLEYAIIKSGKAGAGMPTQCMICLRREE